jgi:hypothetical protein
MAPRKSIKTLPAPADTCPQQTKHPNIALKLTSVILAALREEEELDSTTNHNSDSDDDEEIMNAADESNPEAGEEDMNLTLLKRSQLQFRKNEQRLQRTPLHPKVSSAYIPTVS